MKKFENLFKLLNEIASLLNQLGEFEWENLFKEFRVNLETSKSLEEKKNALREILKIYGGMGSFSDLVVSKDSNFMIDENNNLEKLRKQLYEEVKELILH